MFAFESCSTAEILFSRVYRAEIISVKECEYRLDADKLCRKLAEVILQI